MLVLSFMYLVDFPWYSIVVRRKSGATTGSRDVGGFGVFGNSLRQGFLLSV